MLKKNKKVLLIVLIIIFAIGITGCDSSTLNDFDNGDSYPDDDVVINDLQISFRTSETTSGVSAQLFDDDSPYEQREFNQDNYGEIYQNLSDSEKKNTFTPERMITELFWFELAHPDKRVQISIEDSIRRGPRSNMTIVPAFDLTLSEKIIDGSVLSDVDHNNFYNFNFNIRVRDRDSSTDRVSQFSEVHVDLGEEYESVEFENIESSYDEDTGYHIFSLIDLMPLSDKDKAQSLVLHFDDNVGENGGIEEPFMINPFADGQDNIDRVNPFFWEQDSSIRSSTGYKIYLPGFDIDLTEGNHLIFNWEINDLIELYIPEGTENSPEEHIVTFRLDNPFPITFELEQLGEDLDDDFEDEDHDNEVSHLESIYYDLMNQEMFLKWVNPSMTDFEQIVIVRNEEGYPEDIDDGEVVYEGRKPTFNDEYVERGNKYYYLVMVENKAGYLSEGQNISISAEPPELDEIRFRDDDRNFIDENGIIINKNEDIDVRVVGYIQGDENRRNETVDIAPEWEVVDFDIVDIEYNKGPDNKLLALEKGETTINVTLPEEFGANEAELKVIVD